MYIGHFIRRAHLLPLAVISALTLSVILLGLSGTAHAASGAKLITTMTMGMKIDCSQVPNTEQAQALLTQHHLCGYGASSRSANPDTTVYGDCGSLSLNLFNSGGGYVQWK